jgi:spore coat protein H
MWDPSFDFQGDALTYDLTIAKDPALTSVVEARKGLTETELSLPLPAGVYYWTVTARDATGEWQIPFDECDDESGQRYFGVVRSELK